MGILFDAAKKWQELLEVSYRITIGKKGNTKILEITFREDDLYHLCGMHYITDIDFGIAPKQYRYGRFMKAVLSGRLNENLAEKSSNWDLLLPRFTEKPA